MKLFTTIRNSGILAAAVLALASSAAMAEEPRNYLLQPDEVYDIDIDGDGVSEEISYTSRTAEESGYQATLDLYINSEQIWSVTEEMGYRWDLCQFTLEDGQQYFLASSLSDNDYTEQILLFTADASSVTVIGELTDLTRRSDDNLVYGTQDEQDRPLSAWARAGWVLDTSGNAFTLGWCDAYKSTGNTMLSLSYVIEDQTVAWKEGASLLDGEQVWTAWQSFDTQVSPEDTTAAFHVSEDETVHLLEVVRYDNKDYFKCVNEDGQEGWYADPEEYQSSEQEDGSYLMGYFDEAFFAG